MSDPELPFRSRLSSPADRALSSVEAQASAGRRRLNRFALERAVLLVGGTALMGFSLLVPLAFVLSRRGYALFTWLVLACVTVVVGSVLRRLRRVWLPGADSAVAIDRRAGLEDRLATLVAVAPSARRSRLWDFLLHENLRLLPRWEPRRLEPRTVPRSAWFFTLSLLLALFALWMIPRRGAFGDPSHAQFGEEQFRPRAGEDEEATDESRNPAPSVSLWSDLPESLRRAILGPRASQLFPGVIPNKTLPLDRATGGPAIVGNRMARHGPVRSMPASREAARMAGRLGSASNKASQPKALRPPGPDTAPTASSRPARGDAPKALARVESGRSKNPRRAPHTRDGGSGSGGAGVGNGGDEEGLYGERQAAGKRSGSFALDLDAMRSAQPGTEGESDSASTASSTRLADDQRLDDAIRRAQVPVEYEEIVQKMFSRRAESLDQAGQPE